MVERHAQASRFAGALVFPGGGADQGDRDEGWRGHVLGWDDFTPDARALRITAIRETFEESGILLASRRDGSPVGACAIDARDRVNAGVLMFIDLVRDLGAVLDLHALALFAHWLTPTFAPRRFDTYFFIAHAPEAQAAACDGRETVDAVWSPPDRFLARREAGEAQIVFVTRQNLTLLGQAVTAEDAIANARARKVVTVTPWKEVRDGQDYLILPVEAGYGAVAERVDLANG